jgi:hypothetical protein
MIITIKKFDNGFSVIKDLSAMGGSYQEELVFISTAKLLSWLEDNLPEVEPEEESK